MGWISPGALDIFDKGIEDDNPTDEIIDVEEKIEISVSERNFLSELILNSEDIMEIKSLIEIYGESMEEIRSMRKSIKKYENVIKGLKDIR